MAYRAFDVCAGEYDIVANAFTQLKKWTGSTPAEATTGAYGSKNTFLAQNSYSARSDGMMSGMAVDAYSWFTFDLYIDAMDFDDEWLVAASCYALGVVTYPQLGVTILRGGSPGHFTIKLVTFNTDGLLAPENFADIASAGSAPQDLFQSRIRFNVRQRYNSGADTMDCEVWVNGTKEIDSAGIALPGNDPTEFWSADPSARQAYWCPFQFERTAGKGGTDFDAYWGTMIWNDEAAGVGPTGRPSADYVVTSMHMDADTDDAARDDWTKADANRSVKYAYVDDNNTVDTQESYVYVGQSTADEQEFALHEPVEKGGGTRTVDAVAVVGEFRRSSDTTGKPLEAEVALHCTAGASWTPAIIDTVFPIIRRKTLTVDEDLRCYNLYVLVLGEDLQQAADNDATGGDNADQTPSGSVTDFAPKRPNFDGGDASMFLAYFSAPPAAAAARRIFIT